MDPADAYVNLYDQLCGVDADLLTAWSAMAEVQEAAEWVRLEVERDSSLAERWMPPEMTDEQVLFGVLLGLDTALLHASKQMGYLGSGVLDDVLTRLAMDGRLNHDTSGLLLFRRSSWLRPNADLESLDGFLNLVRVPADLSSDIHVEFVQEAYDLPDPEAMPASCELEPPPLVVAQLPLLAEGADLVWTITEEPQGDFYNVAPATNRLAPHLRRTLAALDDSGAVLGFLPEASLDDELLDQWVNLLRNCPPPDDGKLTWLLLGSGPVLSVGQRPRTDRLPNRAVLVHRNGRVLLYQDKRFGFCLTTAKQPEYGVKHHRNLDERIPHSRRLQLLESRCGRFGVQICEDFNRLEQQYRIVVAGVTHLLVPVLAAAMWKGGWQVKACEVPALATGTRVAVGNGLAIERLFRSEAAPSLLTFSGPVQRPSQHLSVGDLVRCYANPDGAEMSARDDALTPRVGDW